ncbi:MAG: DUF2817 domain-containing protein [Caldithrix sp.]|nr:DUF2817 domain-containing protein [Caldithrix sp.]
MLQNLLILSPHSIGVAHMHFNFKGHLIIIALILLYLGYKFIVPYGRHFFMHMDSKEVYKNMQQEQTPWYVYGNSTNDRPIYVLKLGDHAFTSLIFGAFHGDEQNGFHLVKRLADTLYQNPHLINQSVVLVPVVNPDGLMAKTRTNANKVDINRNFPTDNWSPVYQKARHHPGPNPASEVETQLVLKMIDDFNPDQIISVHAPLEVNNYDGPAEQLADVLHQHNGYPVSADIGYSTPGSFGTYAGDELNIPVVTLELPDVGVDKAWKQNRQALLAAINYSTGN